MLLPYNANITGTLRAQIVKNLGKSFGQNFEHIFDLSLHA